MLTKHPTGQSNEIDVSSAPHGTGIIRVSYMNEPNAIASLEPPLRGCLKSSQAVNLSIKTGQINGLRAMRPAYDTDITDEQ